MNGSEVRDPEVVDCEIGQEVVRENESPGFAINPWSLTFRDKALEAEYLKSLETLMQTSPRLYTIPLFTMIVGVVESWVVFVQASGGQVYFNPLVALAMAVVGSFMGILIVRKFGGRGFARFVKAMQVYVVFLTLSVVWLPLWRHLSGGCANNGHPIHLTNCALMNQGMAPFPSLVSAVMTPLVLTVVYGMQWQPMMLVNGFIHAGCIWLANNQKVEHDVCMITWNMAEAVAVYVSWVHIRQGREMFVWRKVALSESKVELERTFNAFLCHEIRNPFAVIKGFAECLISPAEKEVLPTEETCVAPESGLVRGGINNQELVHHILDSCTHIQRILDNSLDLGKLEQHKLVLEDELINIKAIGDKICSMMSKRLKPGVQLRVRCPDVSIRGDSTRWLQLLLNLVTNAIKFTQSGFVQLEITADEILPGDPGWEKTKKQHALNVQVIDTGCGISEPGQAVLFQKYQQVHGHHHRADQVAADSGTGLGLVISQHIVHLMGCPSGISVRSPWKWQQESGEAPIANEKVGAGSRFSFSVVPKNLTFKMDAEKVGASGPSPTSSPRSPTLVSPIRKHVKATIMVVDDELLNRMVLLSKLRQCEERVRGQLGADRSGLAGEPDACRFSMEVVQAEHAEMALVMMHDKIEARQKQGATDVVHVDIVILDEHMESSGGILKGTEAVTHIRQLAQKHGEKQPVVVLSSGNCSQADRQRYTAMGADATWPKPYPTGDLVVESLVEWVLVDRKPSVF